VATEVTTLPPATLAAATPAPPAETLPPGTVPPVAVTTPAVAATAPPPTKRADARPVVTTPPVSARPPTDTRTVATQPPQTEPVPQDMETTPLDGRAAGEAVASKFGNDRGFGSGRSSYGTRDNLRRREKIPSRIAPGEGVAVRTLSQIVQAEEAYHQKHGRYGTLAEMVTAQTLFLEGPHQNGVILRPGYRITLEVNKDGFRALATPLSGLRFFVGDDAGSVRPGSE